MKMNMISYNNQTQNMGNYIKVATGVNNPNISNRMLYAQKVRNSNRLSTFYVSPTITMDNFQYYYIFNDGEPPMIYQLNAVSDSPGTITYKSSDNSILKINGNVASILGKGQVTVTVLQERFQKYDYGDLVLFVTIM